jgi:plastocyanin
MGGMGGMGGMTASSSSSSTSSASSSSSTSSTSTSSTSSASSSSGSGEPAFNGCMKAAAEDYTAMTKVTIQFAGFSYLPPCIRVKTGTVVTFEGNFGLHPLQGGTVTNGIGVADANSPITLTNSGTSAMFTLNIAEIVSYYCTAHAGSGMMGAIFVEQ